MLKVSQEKFLALEDLTKRVNLSYSKLVSYCPIKYFSAALFDSNFREVVPGELYRCGLMSSKILKSKIEQHNISSVIDLRLAGTMLSADGKNQAEICNSLGADYYLAPTNSGTDLHRLRLKKLIQIIRQARGPVLIHCDNGCHRSGIAAVLYLLENQLATKEIAELQLSLNYGYFQIERKWVSFRKQSKLLDQLVLEYLHSKEDASFESWIDNYEREVNLNDKRDYLAYLATNSAPKLIIADYNT